MLLAKFDQASASAFGLQVRLARIAVNETQEHLAARVGFRLKRLGLVERGRAVVRASERDALVRALPVLAEVPPPWTLGSVAPGIPVVPAGSYAPKEPELA